MTISTPHEQFLAIVYALRCRRPGCPCHMDPNTTKRVNTHCPVHDDQRPSFTVTEAADRVLIGCRAGCLFEDTSQALRTIGVWPDPPRQGLTLDALCEAKKLAPEFVKSLGVHQIIRQGVPAVAIPYYNQAGDEQATHVRVALHGDGRFRWPQGPTPVPYGVQKLQTIYAQGWVLFVEGESDCWSAWQYALPVIGIPGVEMWKPDWAQYFPEKLTKYVWCEPNGWPLVDKVSRDLPDALVLLAPEGVNDLSEAFISGTDLKALLERLRKTAKRAGELSAERKRFENAKAARDALEHSAGLLDDPSLMDRIGEILAQNGFAGNQKNAKLAYLAVTSSVLDRPVNVHVDGPSAAGKSFAVDRVLELFPADAVYRLTSNSELTFVYTDNEFAHKHIVVGEASGLHQDGIGATIVRAIAWEGHVEYETVERGPDGKLHTRRIMKVGPTGIITTSVRPLNDELITRFLTVTVRDDPEQTKLILKETGRRAKTRPARVDVSAFVAAQQWIRLAGRHEVVIPYADVLAELVDPSEVRVRRDFPQTLSLIQASAVLHQRQRDRDDQGRIVASFADYELTHALVEESLKCAKGSLTSAQRAVVEAVHTLYESGQQESVSVAAVAKALGIDRSAASRRLVRPLAEGFVVNVEERKNHPHRLKPGDPLPPPRMAIPDPATLRDLCTLLSTPGNDCTTAQRGFGASLNRENIENPKAPAVHAVALAVQCTANQDGYRPDPAPACALHSKSPAAQREGSEISGTVREGPVSA